MPEDTKEAFERRQAAAPQCADCESCGTLAIRVELTNRHAGYDPEWDELTCALCRGLRLHVHGLSTGQAERAEFVRPMVYLAHWLRREMLAR